MNKRLRKAYLFKEKCRKLYREADQHNPRQYGRRVRWLLVAMEIHSRIFRQTAGPGLLAETPIPRHIRDLWNTLSLAKRIEAVAKDPKLRSFYGGVISGKNKRTFAPTVEQIESNNFQASKNNEAEVERQRQEDHEKWLRRYDITKWRDE